MTDSEQEHLINHLRDLHAIEVHAQGQLSRLAGVTGDENAQAICQEHLEETNEHEKRVKELVEARGHEPSPVVDKTLRGGAVGLRQLADITPDTPPRIVTHLFGLEHLEIAGYELLEQISERESDRDVGETARQILEQERAAAEKVQERFDHAAQQLTEHRDRDDDGEEKETPSVAQLREVHALAQQSLQVLQTAIDDVCQNEEFEQLLREHLKQTQEHARMISERLEALDATPSAVRDLHMGTATSALRDLGAHPPDAYVKLAMNLFCLRQVEVGAHRVLAKVAEHSDDDETAKVAAEIADQKREAAENVRESFPRAVELMYDSDGSYADSRRAESGHQQPEPSPAGG